MDYDTHKQAAEAKNQKEFWRILSKLVKIGFVVGLGASFIAWISKAISWESWTWKAVAGEGFEAVGVILVFIVVLGALDVYIEWKDFYSTWKANH